MSRQILTIGNEEYEVVQAMNGTPAIFNVDSVMGIHVADELKDQKYKIELGSGYYAIIVKLVSAMKSIEELEILEGGKIEKG